MEQGWDAPPPDIESLGPEAWSPDGVVTLGTPVGSAEFTQKKLDERLEKGQALLGEVVQMRDPQLAWQLLIRWVVPHVNRTLRTLSPNLAEAHARKWDVALWAASLTVLGAQGLDADAYASGEPSLSCHAAWAVWARGLLCGRRQRRIGLHGPVRCL